MPDERRAIDVELRPHAPPAARLLHGAPQSLLEQPRGAVLPAHSPFQANPGLRLAQLAVLAQSALAIITAINLMRGTTSLAHLATGLTIATSASLATNYGIGIVLIGAVLLLGGITVSTSSNVVRTLLALLEIVLLGVTLAAHFGGGSVLGFVTVLAMGAGGSAIFPFGVFVGLQSGVIYLLAIHPPTYRAFAR